MLKLIEHVGASWADSWNTEAEPEKQKQCDQSALQRNEGTKGDTMGRPEASYRVLTSSLPGIIAGHDAVL